MNQTGHGLSVGNVIRFNGTSYVKAQADSAANAEVIGIVTAVADADNFTYATGGPITGLSGLTAGTVYFLSPTSAGALTATEPSADGQVSKPLLDATSTTAGVFFNYRGEVLGSGASLSSDGWVAAGETWTYGSADDPTYTFTVSGDVTSKYSLGMKVRLSQSTGGTKYGFITKLAYSAPDTTVTLYMGTDYNLENETISSPYWSIAKAPYGFPLDPSKWTQQYTDTANQSQATPTQNTWYNIGSAALTVPIGAWNVEYMVTLGLIDASVGTWEVQSTLSTANNSESDDTMTAGLGVNGTVIYAALYRSKTLVVTTKTTMYLNSRTTSAGLDTIYNFNDRRTLVIRVTCAYL